jgi:hypothetical protein
MNGLTIGGVGVGADECSLAQGLLDHNHNISDEEYGQRVNQAPPSQQTTTQPIQQQQTAFGIRGISPDDDYSMSAYFLMLVMDVYNLFQKLHPIGRVVLILFLLCLLWNLLL